MEELLNSFGQTINARIAAGMTQDALAEQTGVTPRYIMAIENENKTQECRCCLNSSAP
ncbi:MAG: helix-turn-helix transcriptional regulator [Clostridium sp.]|uniref:helix-turn-helix domain-containing protein n=1 Tax=Clostridium sp. TaxID=1506 RepID=UPI00290CD8DE|nr:helix-turn-helix transcriptional regulator [Clostridium sp.]MDU7336636.1 helix-turn-helix transcriptional regulator [Clostridium sp.]